MTKIEWTDATWNPVTGCSPVSAGCAHCYAAGMTRRLARIAPTHKRYGGLVGIGKTHFNKKIRLNGDELQRPFRWHKPRMVFVCSMSDLFHPQVPFEFIDRVFAVMALTPQHTYQVLTKRPERFAEYLSDVRMAERVYDAQARWNASPRERRGRWPFRNVWLGTSCEDQAAADERIPHLLRCPAAVRFVSLEPLLGPIDVGLQSATCGCCDRWPSRWVVLRCPVRSDIPHSVRQPVDRVADVGVHRAIGNMHGALSIRTPGGLLGIKPPEFECLPALDWVIVGGESGPRARPCNVEWIRDIVQECKAAAVRCFVKQLGANPTTEFLRCPECGWISDEDGWDALGADYGKRFCNGCSAEVEPVWQNDPKGGDPAEWPADLRVREWPEVKP